MVAFVARERELKELDDALTAATAGQGGAVVLSGPVGSGKTTLLQAFGERAEKAGARVLWAAGRVRSLVASCRSVVRTRGLISQVASELGALSARVPLVLAVDDAADVDAESIALLQLLLCLITTAPP